MDTPTVTAKARITVTDRGGTILTQSASSGAFNVIVQGARLKGQPVNVVQQGHIDPAQAKNLVVSPDGTMTLLHDSATHDQVDYTIEYAEWIASNGAARQPTQVHSLLDLRAFAEDAAAHYGSAVDITLPRFCADGGDYVLDAVHPSRHGTAAEHPATPEPADEVLAGPEPVDDANEDAAPEDEAPQTQSATEATVPEPATRREARHSFLKSEQIEEPAAHGWRGFFTRLGLRMTPGQSERSERDDVRAVSQHWPGPRTIFVGNGRGGAAKTMSTIALSAVFARYGGAGVLAEDNNQTRGTLGWRTEQGPHDASLLELLPEVDRLLSPSAQAADLAHFVHHQTRDKYDVLRSRPELLADAQRFDADTVDAVHAVASKYYRLLFVDSGNDESDAMWLRMIHHANQLVVPTTTRRDSAESAALLLDALHERGGHHAALAENAVVIVSQENPSVPKNVLDELAGGFKPLARDVVTIPFDPAMKDGLLTFGSLRPATCRAWLRAAAAVARGL